MPSNAESRKQKHTLTSQEKSERAAFAARRHFAMYAPAGQTFDMQPADTRSILYNAMHAALEAVENDWRPGMIQ